MIEQLNILFALMGAKFLKLMGMSLDSFRIAGGTLLFLIALGMVFARGIRGSFLS